MIVQKGKGFFGELVEFMTSGIVVGLELVKDDAIKAWRTFMGPTNVDQAIKEAPESVRAKFGTAGDLTRNSTHGSDSPKSAARELDFFFGFNSPLKPCPLTKNSSLCLIKPHIISSNKLGVVSDILLN